jgi:hypothetical protein
VCGCTKHPGSSLQRGFVPKKGGFWERNADQLEEIAYETRRAYLRRMKEAHPDVGGTEEHAAYINDLYAQACRAFKYHGVEVQ